jgi:flagellar secretion chaperone FliS
MNNYEQGKQEYLRTKVLTASPAEIHLMLYDGAIRFTEKGKLALQEADFETAYNSLVRAQNIVLEMTNGLDHEAQPELCAKLSSLYNFIYRRLVEGSMKRDLPALGDALRILNHQRETWDMLMDKISKNQFEPSVSSVDDARNKPAQDPFNVQPGMSLSLSV